MKILFSNFRQIKRCKYGKKFEYDELFHSTVDFATKVKETEEEFIFQTVEPFCRDILERKISKKELREMLLRAERMKWIPCSERMPENDMEEVLVWFEYNQLFQTVGTSHTFRGEWSNFVNGSSGWKDLRIIAWMPLPEPYKGE